MFVKELTDVLPTTAIAHRKINNQRILCEHHIVKGAAITVHVNKLDGRARATRRKKNSTFCIVMLAKCDWVFIGQSVRDLMGVNMSFGRDSLNGGAIASQSLGGAIK